VATDFDRDDRLHGLLRDTLRSQPASGPCIDAATLAAWAEDALTPEETAATDTHLATCERCRELAATFSTMAESEGAPAAAVVPFKPRPSGRWKVIVGAMGAVAASALIWVAVRDESPRLDTTSAANRAEQSQASGVGGNVAPAATVPARPAEGGALQPRADPASPAERQLGQQRQQALGTPRPESKLARENNARLAEPRQSNAKPSPAPIEPPPARVDAPPPPAVMPPPPQPVRTAPPPPAAPPPVAATAAPRADLLRSSEALFATAPIVAEFVVGADLQLAQAQQGQAFGGVADRSAAGGAGRGAGGGGRGGGAAAGAVAQKPTNAVVLEPVRWRLRGSSPSPTVSMTTLERSNDGGTTWQPVPIPVTPLLAGGSAPTNTVCWLAGRAGTVLLSTDGTTFRQVTKPAEADLVSVRATDARRATITTADGRTFATSDGGVTWTSR